MVLHRTSMKKRERGKPRAPARLAERYRAVKLETAYRIPGSVYQFAKGITEALQEKINKDFRPFRTFEGFIKEIPGLPLLIRHIGKDLDGHKAKPYRWYLLFRNNCFIEDVVEILKSQTIPYSTAQGFCIPEPRIAWI